MPAEYQTSAFLRGDARKDFFDKDFFTAKTKLKGGTRNWISGHHHNLAMWIHTCWPDTTVLEIGGGLGQVTKILAGCNQAAVNMDISRYAVLHGFTQAQIEGDIIRHTLPPLWDVVCCWNVVGYFHDDDIQPALANIAGASKTGTPLIVTWISQERWDQAQKDGSASFSRAALRPERFWVEQFARAEYVPITHPTCPWGSNVLWACHPH